MPVRHVTVISDLHLGGAEGFQMCTPETRAQLARFVRELGQPEARAGRPEAVELVVAGDFVDFLAEPDDPAAAGFSAFTADPGDAVAKLERILDHVDGGRDEDAQVFAAFRAFTRRGHRLTVLAGNHDLELCLPGVRERLVTALTGDSPSRLRHLYDGEALRIGDLVIDHGHRADGWNQVSQDDLRRWRSALSREELHDRRARFRPPLGSRLVVEVMNRLKAELPFVDLLKPETEAVLPLLVALRPDVLREIPAILRYRTEAALHEQAPGDPPRFAAAIAATGEFDLDYDPMRPAIARAHPGEEETGLAPLSGTEAGGGALLRALGRIARAPEADRPALLRQTFLRFEGAQRAVVDPLREHPRWEKAARRLAGGLPRVVVFGHTHLAKDVPLNDLGGRYLNTGTWCGLMRLPSALWRPTATPEDERAAVAQVATYLDDLRTRWRSWCDPHPTAVQAEVELSDGSVRSASIIEVRADGEVAPFVGYRPVIRREEGHGPA